MCTTLLCKLLVSWKSDNRKEGGENWKGLRMLCRCKCGEKCINCLVAALGQMAHG